MKSLTFLVAFDLSAVLAQNQPKGNFTVYEKSYYEGKHRGYEIVPSKCLQVPPFASAIFSGNSTDFFIMCSDNTCSKNCVLRSMRDSSSPGDNLKDYGTLMGSVIFVKQI
ncbi:hypothetical protein BB559_005638 [Furculomyces boomerangus]|uniref:Uncharacterized protein n=2 Tax=Harpellales TaxID=61421 RepID=A0A2T9Y7I9_9FUNG|nr:hypothetical protein BB559_005638 [Furculomyces boomerangus]PWA00360.1 hypothetical protein BB558_003580 [Smittium angustum]